MKKIQKGQPGYIRTRKIKLGIGTISGFLLMALIYLTGYLIFDTGKNFVTILAVLVVLPVAKIFVQYLLLPWGVKADETQYDELKKTASPLLPYCELMITAQEKSFAIVYLVIDKDENIVAYTTQPKVEPDRFEKGVTNFLNYYEFDAKVKLFTDFRQFEKRVKQLAAKNTDISDEQKEHIAVVFEKLSIMSV
ncbi:MAG: hypothetical protein ACI4EU_03505 [Butyrivibrio sp.]